MARIRVFCVATWLIAGVVVPGCAAKQQKHRLAMLEQANAKLTDRLNRAHDELAQAHQRRDEIQRKYLATVRDAEELRKKLAEQPKPETTAPGWTPVPGGAMIAIETGVLFAPGRATLQQPSRRTLDAIVSTIEGEYRDKAIFVIGHTDDRPIRKSGWKDNWELSVQRALAVVRYLTQQHIAPDRLTACGAGEYRPRTDNDSAAHRKANRRVEIYAVDPSLLNTPS